MIVSFTVLLPTQQVLAASRLLRLHDHTRRSISRIFRMVTLSLGITPSFVIKQEREDTCWSYPATTLSNYTGRIAPEWWPESNRNAGPDSAGIRSKLLQNKVGYYKLDNVLKKGTICMTWTVT